MMIRGAPNYDDLQLTSPACDLLAVELIFVNLQLRCRESLCTASSPLHAFRSRERDYCPVSTRL